MKIALLYEANGRHRITNLNMENKSKHYGKRPNKLPKNPNLIYITIN